MSDSGSSTESDVGVLSPARHQRGPVLQRRAAPAGGRPDGRPKSAGIPPGAMAASARPAHARRTAAPTSARATGRTPAAPGEQAPRPDALAAGASPATDQDASAAETDQTAAALVLSMAPDDNAVFLAARSLGVPVLSTAEPIDVARAMVSAGMARAALAHFTQQRPLPPPSPPGTARARTPVPPPSAGVPGPRDALSSAARTPPASPSSRSALATRLTASLTDDDLLAAATFYGVDIGEGASVAEAIANAGLAPMVLEDAAASQLAATGADTQRELPPASNGARGGPERSTTTGPSEDPTVSRVASLERMFQEHFGHAAEVRALSSSFSATDRARLLGREMVRPSSARLSSLAFAAQSNEAAVHDMGLYVPSFPSVLDADFAQHQANSYCARELQWAVQHSIDSIHLQHQMWNLLARAPLAQSHREALAPVICKLEQVWCMTHGHYNDYIERLRTLARGLVTRSYDARPEVPRPAGTRPEPCVSVEEVAKWEKMADRARKWHPAQRSDRKRAHEPVDRDAPAKRWQPAARPAFRGGFRR